MPIPQSNYYRALLYPVRYTRLSPTTYSRTRSASLMMVPLCWYQWNKFALGLKLGEWSLRYTVLDFLANETLLRITEVPGHSQSWREMWKVSSSWNSHGMTHLYIWMNALHCWWLCNFHKVSVHQWPWRTHPIYSFLDTAGLTYSGPYERRHLQLAMPGIEYTSGDGYRDRMRHLDWLNEIPVLRS